MTIVYVGFAILAGLCTTLQSATNGQISKQTSAPTAILLTAVAFLALATIYFLFSTYPNVGVGIQKIRELQISQLILGGLFGFGVVVSLTICFPNLGALWTIVLMILAQAVSAMIVDHFGFFDQTPISISPSRVLAIVLLIISTLLLRR